MDNVLNTVRQDPAWRMAKIIDDYQYAGDHGWIAVRLSDGGSDGRAYAGRVDAEAAQSEPCAYLALTGEPWTDEECGRYLRSAAELAAAGLAHTPIVHRRSGRLFGLPDLAPCYVAARKEGQQVTRTAVSRDEMLANLVLHLPGSGRRAAAEGRAIHLSISEPGALAVQVTYTPIDEANTDELLAVLTALEASTSRELARQITDRRGRLAFVHAERQRWAGEPDTVKLLDAADARLRTHLERLMLAVLADTARPCNR
ncbi:hypothetical protein [Streptomyces syringium]|uniref:hypothetical protein n=1 Tax=Streptomyces syringium TaxID=76729 RepID=UPI003AB07EB3